MSKRLPNQAEERLRALYEKIDGCDGKLWETIRKRDLARQELQELEYYKRQRTQQPGQVGDEVLDSAFDDRLNRARENLGRLSQRYNEIGAEKMPLIRLKERLEAYALSAGFMMPDDDIGTVRDRAFAGGAK